MSQSKHEIESLLTQAGSHPRHRFGQNFMIDQNLVRIVADAGQIGRDDLVLEVGPGTGTLTEELLDRGGHIVAVEIDRDLAALLKARFASRENFTLIEGDALAGKHALNPQILATLASPQFAGKPRKLVANLPYHIASPLIIELLIAGVDLLAFTVQKEVGLRLKAPAGSDDYGPLSVMAQMLAAVEVLRTLSPQAFWPAPTIDSALVRMTRHDRLGGRANEFSRFIHALFSFRRKMLRKALSNAGYDAGQLVQASGLDGHRRPEEFSPEELYGLFCNAWE
ncbi:MAG TPA: 16S rRNA (adenine(1518)-N(6)/adenine(1519)-N(6))-dimethyltransferase RsmA [Tepidisphaeraceae bacterium]|jgi:16S rRNA (adenine1518-N6/adenine1519-N6)-dimethyltransferase|nr:16S rRNA (adenine(1518)-N(6)/adenine(1519)-N(6))-dimethyltransferase RsmA [Tepidisphaeraceae bacterium]